MSYSIYTLETCDIEHDGVVRWRLHVDAWSSIYDGGTRSAAERAQVMALALSRTRLAARTITHEYTNSQRMVQRSSTRGPILVGGEP